MLNPRRIRSSCGNVHPSRQKTGKKKKQQNRKKRRRKNKKEKERKKSGGEVSREREGVRRAGGGMPTSLRLSISALLPLLPPSHTPFPPPSSSPSCLEPLHERPWTNPQTNFNMELHWRQRRHPGQATDAKILQQKFNEK